MFRGGLSILVLASIGVLAPGCASLRGVTVSVTIPHPSRVSLIPAATQIAANNPNVDVRNGLMPGSLVDRAAITRIDDENVCVEVAFWAWPGDPTRSDLEQYDFVLAAHDETGREIGMRREPQRSPIGAWTVTRNGRPSWRTPMAIPQVRIGYAAADLCFSNEHLIDESTRSLSLAFRRGESPERYIWQLDPSGTYPAGADAQATIRPEYGPPQQAQRYATQGQGGALTALPYTVQQVPGGHPIDTEWVSSLLDARFGDLRRCLDRAGERDPRLISIDGSAIAEFTIGPSGVGNVRVVHNDFTPDVAACLTQHLSALAIPPDPMRWVSLFRYGVRTRPARQM